MSQQSLAVAAEPAAASEPRQELHIVEREEQKPGHCPPLAPGHPLAPGYTVLDHVHRTGTYDVYEVWSEQRACHCVAKTLRPERADDAAERRELAREGRRLQRFTHPHIVRAYETLLAPAPMVILETLPGPTLETLIEDGDRPLAVADVACLGVHLCSAMAYLHGQGLLHLDLKPSNIISVYGFAKVLDLSIARPPGRGRRGEGTRIYMAPEQATGGMLTSATDVWGIGGVLYEALTGAPAFEYRDHGKGYEQLERRAAPVRTHRRVPATLATAVDRCLDPDPSRRPAVAELLSLLQPLAS